MTALTDRAKAGILFHAKECENCCRMAQFAADEGMESIADGMRRKAEYHSEQAFAWTAKPDPIPGLTHSADAGHYEAGDAA